MKPLGTIVLALPAVAGAIACFDRLQSHLVREEREDNRLAMTMITKTTTLFDVNIEDPHLEIEFSHIMSEKADSDVGASSFEIGRDSMSPELDGGKAAFELADLRTETSAPFHPVSSSSTLVSVEGTLTRHEESKTVLDIPLLEIQNGTFTMIIGPIGCGKSTLLNVILGENSDFQGTLRSSCSRIAYCSQEPFVPNLTCQEVILGNLPYESTWYHQVVRACRLNEDFRQWSKGDLSPVGSAAISLSGGQKQRIALARAVYSRYNFVILDDSFAGLDAAVANEMFDRLLGRDGLLRTHGRTVILASASSRWAAYSDWLVVMGPDGSIIDQDTFTNLSSRPTTQTLLNLQGHENERRRRGREQKSKEEIEVEDLGAKSPPAIANDKELQLNRKLTDSSVYLYYIKAAGTPTVIAICASLVVLAFCDTFPSKPSCTN